MLELEKINKKIKKKNQIFVILLVLVILFAKSVYAGMLWPSVAPAPPNRVGHEGYPPWGQLEVPLSGFNFKWDYYEPGCSGVPAQGPADPTDGGTYYANLDIHTCTDSYQWAYDQVGCGYAALPANCTRIGWCSASGPNPIFSIPFSNCRPAGDNGYVDYSRYLGSLNSNQQYWWTIMPGWSANGGGVMPRCSGPEWNTGQGCVKPQVWHFTTGNLPTETFTPTPIIATFTPTPTKTPLPLNYCQACLGDYQCGQGSSCLLCQGGGLKCAISACAECDNYIPEPTNTFTSTNTPVSFIPTNTIVPDICSGNEWIETAHYVGSKLMESNGSMPCVRADTGLTKSCYKIVINYKGLDCCGTQSDGDGIWIGGNNASQYGVDFIYSNNRLLFNMGQKSTTHDGTWHNYTIEKIGDSTKFYLDGSPFATGKSTRNPPDTIAWGGSCTTNNYNNWNNFAYDITFYDASVGNSCCDSIDLTPTPDACFIETVVEFGALNITSTPTQTDTSTVSPTPTVTPTVTLTPTPLGTIIISRIGAESIIIKVPHSILWSADATSVIEATAEVVADRGKSGKLVMAPDKYLTSAYFDYLRTATPVTVLPNYPVSLNNQKYKTSSSIVLGGNYKGIGTLLVEYPNTVSINSNIVFPDKTVKNALFVVVSSPDSLVEINSAVTNLQHVYIYSLGEIKTGASTSSLLTRGTLASDSKVTLERIANIGLNEQLMFDWSGMVFCPPGMCYLTSFNILSWKEVPAI